MPHVTFSLGNPITTSQALLAKAMHDLFATDEKPPIASVENTEWTRVRICAETYGFARQKTRGGSMNLILISWMRFLVDFRPQIAF
jgi:hypothetical protein